MALPQLPEISMKTVVAPPLPVPPEDMAIDPTWALPSRDIEEARAIQRQSLQDIADEYAKRMLEGEAHISSWAYHPPANDDWRTWTGALRWCALMVRLRITCNALRAIHHGGGPTFCWSCTEKQSVASYADAGWSQHPCLDCEWDATGYDEALAYAKLISKHEALR